MPRSKRSVRALLKGTGIVRTKPSWTLRGIALAGIALGIYVVSPWFVPPPPTGVLPRTGAASGLLESTLGRWLFFGGVVAISSLLWAISARRDTRPRVRWWQQQPFARKRPWQVPSNNSPERSRDR
jgi:hypothetical protein